MRQFCRAHLAKRGLLPDCRQSARNLNASNANRKKNLVPGGVAGHETLGLLRIAFAGITSQHRVSEDRSAALNDAVVPMAGDQLRWRSPLNPFFQGVERIEFSESRTSSAMMNPRNEE